MRSALPSTLLRQSVRRPALRTQRRFASSSPTQEAAQKKAQDALANAQVGAEKLLASVKKILGPVGEKAGQLLGSYKEPLVYNAAVAREVVKQIYHAERLSPPSLATVREAYAELWSQVSNPAALRQLVQSGQLAQVGIYGLQAYGIFKIGEIIGRRSLVGYKIQ
ncbi:hypothetical protein D9611_001125 [Ephemerocybe angulata]|uniref:Uncharacterized protein n=1 Tax=Ephemerocybe angulata TaxID=980116 RepID=A0A8H5CIJ4_9AGAR|nr:hypothetical protein D9611_001125 [Tulosesus angulatus]